MLYTSLPALDGLRGPRGAAGARTAAGWTSATGRGATPTRWRRSVSTSSDVTEAVAAGEMDAAVEELGRILRESRQAGLPADRLRVRRPVEPLPAGPLQARVAPDRRHPPRAPVGREAPIAPVTNVALVWHSAAYSTYEGHPFEAWYPGDDCRRLGGGQLVPVGAPEDEAIAAAARDRVAALARQHRKPLMIAEAAPKAYFQADAPDAWTGWHARVFAWIAQNDVKAYCYINQDWNAMPQWPAACGGGDWGDTRCRSRAA